MRFRRGTARGSEDGAIVKTPTCSRHGEAPATLLPATPVGSKSPAARSTARFPDRALHLARLRCVLGERASLRSSTSAGRRGHWPPLSRRSRRPRHRSIAGVRFARCGFFARRGARTGAARPGCGRRFRGGEAHCASGRRVARRRRAAAQFSSFFLVRSSSRALRFSAFDFFAPPAEAAPGRFGAPPSGSAMPSSQVS